MLLATVNYYDTEPLNPIIPRIEKITQKWSKLATLASHAKKRLFSVRFWNFQLHLRRRPTPCKSFMHGVKTCSPCKLKQVQRDTKPARDRKTCQIVRAFAVNSTKKNSRRNHVTGHNHVIKISNFSKHCKEKYQKLCE